MSKNYKELSTLSARSQHTYNSVRNQEEIRAMGEWLASDTIRLPPKDQEHRLAVLNHAEYVEKLLPVHDEELPIIKGISKQPKSLRSVSSWNITILP
ncbi:hypothetical protein CPB86DRAFT_302820 [Serendipita vermifera]|nr:hypothetical protein CPB86DRAFT_302820 [Serendipita vermifera]